MLMLQNLNVDRIFRHVFLWEGSDREFSAGVNRMEGTILVGMSWYMVSWSWKSLGLPDVRVMVLQFKDLELWVQLGFFFASSA